MTDNKKTKLPDFLIIGAGKSGTTSLNNYLKQHPQIYIPDKKEPNFFAYETVDRDAIKQNESLCKHYDQSITNIVDYRKMFESAGDNQVIGETSNLYLYDPRAVFRIKHYIPEAKFIAILRNPVGRLYSRYLHLARENRIDGIDFKDVFDESSIWYQRPDLLKEGFYYKNLNNFMQHFRKDQFLIFLYEDLQNNQSEVIKKIFAFLGVDPTFQPNTEVDYNRSGFVKNKFVNQFVDGNGLAIKMLKKTVPSLYRKAKSSLAVQKFFYSLKSKNLYNPKFDKELRSKILISIYKEDIEALEKLIDRDLQIWLK